MSATWKRLTAAGAAMLAISVAVVSLMRGANESGGKEQPSAIYKNGRIALEIPYRAERAGEGQLSVELLDPEGEVLDHAERKASTEKGEGVWRQELKPEALPYQELVWQRVRYRFQYSGEPRAAFEGTRAVSEILRRPVVHVIGQTRYLAGAEAAVRVIVADTDGRSMAGSVRVELADKILFAGKLNARGTAEAQFRFPAGVIGNQELRFVALTPLGEAESRQPVKLDDKAQILITTEKRMYQPGQTVHVRTLILNQANHHAMAGPVTFEISDARGNKVFKKATEADEYGIASAEFALADEVNLGRYEVKALMGDAESPSNQAELSFLVERYVLPKFKVAVNFDKGKRDYRPGEHVTGTVEANYFFGKAVEGGVRVKASSMDVAMTEAATANGRMDDKGSFHFDLQLPSFFVGRSSTTSAPVVIEAEVKDGAGHAETHGESVTVSEQALVVTAIPEGGTLIPGFENKVYVVASYPDGRPAAAVLQIHAAGMVDETVSTDAQGVAEIRVAAGEKSEALRIKADDRKGNRAERVIRLQPREGQEQVLVRTERGVYKAGERVALTVLSTHASGAVYVDVVKDGQTVLTRDLEVSNGRAELTFVATAEMAGTLGINAYRFSEGGETVEDHRLLFVQPAEELRIQAVADAPVYKPGAEARIQFRVTNEHGQGVRAALGLQVVDEAVFALAEQRPGFAKTFFYLEQELLKPRYEIHGFSLPDVADPTEDAAARVVLAATEMVAANRMDVKFGNEMPQDAGYRARYQEAFEDQVAAGERTDAWGTAMRVEKLSWPGRGYYSVTSAGMDRKFGTEDDLRTVVDTRTGKIMNRRGPRSTMNVRIEHERGANGWAEVRGTVEDASGTAIEKATVTVGAAHRTMTDKNGAFRLTGLAQGRYLVAIEASGFQRASKWLTLEARDSAVVSGVMTVGWATQMVEVEAAAPMMRFEGADMARAQVMAGALMKTMPREMRMAAPASAQAEETHVRSYFPEALYVNPEIITDRNGAASITIPMADSITNWRMAMMASTAAGALGTANAGVKVFQDFFVDLDLPVRLTQGDRVTIPAAIYNYAGGRGEVTAELEADDWYGVEGAREKQVEVDAGKVGSVDFTIEAKRIGKFKLKVMARMEGSAKRRDIVVREIEVVPNGREQDMVFNGGLDHSVEHTVEFPKTAIADASKMFVRLYPGPLSQVMEGMDAILQMPGGCFEQTSSSTYPNVLALDYMKRTKKLTPEIHAKAEGYITNGYQRLLTFEVQGGGFSWFGNAPANKILTAYGLMEFRDMAKVHEVDEKVIARTSEWLVRQQQSDGSWKPDTQFINEGATNRYNSDAVRITAYVGWALENSGYKGVAIEKARRFVAEHLSEKADAYTLAVAANFAVEGGADDLTRRAMEALLAARVEDGEHAHWNAVETAVFARGESASVETTGLATQALLKWRQDPEVARKALAYLAAKKDAAGTWGTTQATIMALRAMLMASEHGSDATGTVEVALNGTRVKTIALTAENNDLYQQIVLPNVADQGANRVELRFAGKGGLAYQVVGRYFVPWDERAEEEPLSIDVAYDRSRLKESETVGATATIRNNQRGRAEMVMVDLGIPPGFELLTEDLEGLREKTAQQASGRLEKFSLTATQAILYFNGFDGKSVAKVHFRLRAKYPIRARTFESKVYEYYDPSVKSVARPVVLEVGGR